MFQGQASKLPIHEYSAVAIVYTTAPSLTCAAALAFTRALLLLAGPMSLAAPSVCVCVCVDQQRRRIRTHGENCRCPPCLNKPTCDGNNKDVGSTLSVRIKLPSSSNSVMTSKPYSDNSLSFRRCSAFPLQDQAKAQTNSTSVLTHSLTHNSCTLTLLCGLQLSLLA